MCFVTSEVLLESKGKGFDLDFPCNSSSFIFNQSVFFHFQFQCSLVVLIFLFPFLFPFSSFFLSFFHF